MNLDSLKTILPQANEPLGTLIWLAVFIVSGIFLGILAEFFIRKFVTSWVKKTTWVYDDFLVRALKGIPVPLFAVFSFYICSLILPDLHATQIISNRICFAIAAFLITLAIARFLSKLIRQLSSTAEVPLPSSLLSNLASVVVFLIGTLVTLQTLGISITPILTTLGIGGLAVALALQDTLANLFSGIYILISKQVHIGDFIRLDTGNEGTVTDITWRNTIIRTVQGNLIIIPNNKLSSAIISNFSRPNREYTFSLEFNISYTSDLSSVEKIAFDAAKKVITENPGAVTSFDPIIRFLGVSNSLITMAIIMRASAYTNQGALKSQCLKEIQKRFKEENIEIPYPTQTIKLDTKVICS
ncbi:MAG: mechanosensitive ion channel family protein [Fibrobacter sp.]|nr:mechanosensitive ion channel family protein [Fibrobacter sp.]